MPAARAEESVLRNSDVVMIGTAKSHARLKLLLSQDWLKPPPTNVQSYTLRIGASPYDPQKQHGLAALAGADDLGTLNAVRDFCHYHLPQKGGPAAFRAANVQTAPRMQARMLSEGGTDVSSFAGKALRLRFVMKDADLYARRFAAAPSAATAIPSKLITHAQHRQEILRIVRGTDAVRRGEDVLQELERIPATAAATKCQRVEDSLPDPQMPALASHGAGFRFLSAFFCCLALGVQIAKYDIETKRLDAA